MGQSPDFIRDFATLFATRREVPSGNSWRGAAESHVDNCGDPEILGLGWDPGDQRTGRRVEAASVECFAGLLPKIGSCSMG